MAALGPCPRAPVHEGQRVALSGALVSQGAPSDFANPDVEPADSPPLHTRRIVPVYALTKGIYDNWLRTLVARAVRTIAPTIDDPLPASHAAKAGSQPRREAIAAVHLPPDQRALEAARSRLAFDELLTVQLVVLQRRRRARGGGAIPVPGHPRPSAALARRRSPSP